MTSVYNYITIYLYIGKRIAGVDRLDAGSVSLEDFARRMNGRRPLVLLNHMEHWPCMSNRDRRWSDLNYIKRGMLLINEYG